MTRSLLFLIIFISFSAFRTNQQIKIAQTSRSMGTYHHMPATIQQQVLDALSFFPELSRVPIVFQLEKNIRNSVMLAQPDFRTLFKPKDERKYVIKISERFKITGEEFRIEELPKPVLVGWIGHELGHIIDYQGRSGLNLILFGLRYTLSKRFLIAAEKRADTYAVNHGMRKYILVTKNFILDHAHISEAYKNKIRKFYLSPEEIMQMLPDDE